MKIAKSKIVDALRDRGQDIRAEWVDRELPDSVDTTQHTGLLSMLHLDPATLVDEPTGLRDEPAL